MQAEAEVYAAQREDTVRLAAKEEATRITAAVEAARVAAEREATRLVADEEVAQAVAAAAQATQIVREEAETARPAAETGAKDVEAARIAVQDAEATVAAAEDTRSNSQVRKDHDDTAYAPLQKFDCDPRSISEGVPPARENRASALVPSASSFVGRAPGGTLTVLSSGTQHLSSGTRPKRANKSERTKSAAHLQDNSSQIPGELRPKRSTLATKRRQRQGRESASVVTRPARQRAVLDKEPAGQRAAPPGRHRTTGFAGRVSPRKHDALHPTGQSGMRSKSERGRAKREKPTKVWFLCPPHGFVS